MCATTRVAVLHVGLLHRNEDDVGVVSLDDEVRGVREQRVVLVRVDVRAPPDPAL